MYGLNCQCHHPIIPSVTSNCSPTSLSVSPMSSSLTLTSSAPPMPGAGNMTNNMPRSNTKSVLTNDDRLTLETLNQFKNGAKSFHTSKPDKVGKSPVNKKGTHTATSSLAKVINIETVDQAQSSSASKRARTKEVKKVEKTVAKKEYPESELHKFMMFGANLNPSSLVAKDMSTMPQVMR